MLALSFMIFKMRNSTHVHTIRTAHGSFLKQSVFLLEQSHFCIWWRKFAKISNMASGDKFKEINHIMGSPKGRETDVEQLGVALSTHPQYPSDHFTIMKMKLTEKERKKVAETGDVWVSIMGLGMPPLRLCGDHPFKDLGYVPLTDEEIESIKNRR